MLFISESQKQKIERLGFKVRTTKSFDDNTVCTKDGVVKIQQGNRFVGQSEVVEIIRHHSLAYCQPKNDRMSKQEKDFLLQ